MHLGLRCGTGTCEREELTDADPETPVTFVEFDLERPAEIVRAAEAIGAAHGRVDVLVNNAQIEIDRTFEETMQEMWERIMAISLRAPFLLTQALLRCFPENGGAVINVSSIHATHCVSGPARVCVFEGGDGGADAEPGARAGTARDPGELHMPRVC